MSLMNLTLSPVFFGVGPCNIFDASTLSFLIAENTLKKQLHQLV